MNGDTYQVPAHGWTCFHCGETFTTVGSARAHFGETPLAQPGCMERVRLGAERGLLMALRETESLLARYVEEDTSLHRAMAEAQSRHVKQLLDAEEAGYERGLRDAPLSLNDGIELAAKLLQRKADDYMQAWSSIAHETGAVEWGRGSGGEARQEYHSTLCELAEEVLALRENAASVPIAEIQGSKG